MGFRFLILAQTAAAALTPVVSLPVGQPLLHSEDSWRYKNTSEQQGRFAETHDDSTIVRTQADAIVLRVRASDSPLQPTEVLVGTDWSRFRSIDGQETVVNHPFDFPLTLGKTWTVDYRETNPNRNFSTEHLITTYKVVGLERVTVPAGTFDAIKIEANGRWTATLANAETGVATTRSDMHGVAVTNRLDRQLQHDATGRLYKAFWYSPVAKRAVKVVEEAYNSAGTRSDSRTSELESYKVAN